MRAALVTWTALVYKNIHLIFCATRGLALSVKTLITIKSTQPTSKKAGCNCVKPKNVGVNHRLRKFEIEFFVVGRSLSVFSSTFVLEKQKLIRALGLTWQVASWVLFGLLGAAQSLWIATSTHRLFAHISPFYLSQQVLAIVRFGCHIISQWKLIPHHRFINIAPQIEVNPKCCLGSTWIFIISMLVSIPSFACTVS